MTSENLLDDEVRMLLDKIAVDHKFYFHKVEICPLATDGANFTSDLYAVTISEDNKDNLELVVKRTNMSVAMRNNVPFEFFDLEYIAYSKIAKIYKELEDKHRIPEDQRFQFPQYYGAHLEKPNEVLVLENLSKSGFLVYDRAQSIDWPFAKGAVTAMARLHALSMAYQKEKPKEFRETCENIKGKWSSEDGGKEGFLGSQWSPYIESALAVIKDENKGRFAKFMDNKIYDFFWTPFSELTKPLRRTVLAHCGCRTSNLMARVQKTGEVQVTPIDYQTLQPSSPASDLVYFLTTATDEQFRKRHYQQMIDHYYSELCAALRRFEIDPALVYSRQDFEFELKEKLPLGLGYATFSLKLVLKDTGRSVDYRNLFSDRMNGLVDDFINWGFI